jgi:hypothetical protein
MKRIIRHVFSWGVWATVTLSGLALAQPLDVNDVSYLWAPPTSPTNLNALLKLQDVRFGDRPAIPKSLFDQWIQFAKGDPLQGYQLQPPAHLTFETDLQNWVVAALRVDPCAPSTSGMSDRPEDCIQEIRLVAQPAKWIEGVTMDLPDVALHLLFHVSAGAPQDSKVFVERVRQLVELKKKYGIQTDGLPLGIHPGLVKPQSGFFKDFQSWALQALSQAVLKQVTFAGIGGQQGPWLFFQGTVDPQGLTYRLEADPNLSGQPMMVVTPGLLGEGIRVQPAPTNQEVRPDQTRVYRPSVMDLFYQGTLNLQAPATLGDGSLSQQLRVGDVGYFLDHPRLAHRGNTDCLSCHSVTSRHLILGLGPSSPYQYQMPLGVTALSSYLVRSHVNFRAFGWFGAQPVANQRVTQESAEAAAQINREILQIPQNQWKGMACQDRPKMEAALACTQSAKSPQEAKKCVQWCANAAGSP